MFLSEAPAFLRWNSISRLFNVCIDVADVVRDDGGGEPMDLFSRDDDQII